MRLLTLPLLLVTSACLGTKDPGPPPSLADLSDWRSARVTHPDSSRTVLQDLTISGSTLEGDVHGPECEDAVEEPQRRGRSPCPQAGRRLSLTLPSPSVSRLDARKYDTKAFEGLKIGGLGAGLGGFLVGYCLSISSDDCAEDLNGGIAVGAVLGAAGALIGLAIGSFIQAPWVEVPLEVRPRAGRGLDISFYR